MIKVENLNVMNWDGAVRGMRNPMNSWAKSDSYIDECGQGYIGEADLDLMKRLIRAGSDHSKFMRQILVCFDIVLPLRMWKEFDTYSVGVTRNSCSTMHKLTQEDLTAEVLYGKSLNDLSDLQLQTLDWFQQTQSYIKDLCGVRDQNGDMSKKSLMETGRLFTDMIDNLPSSYMQRSTITCNYAVLRNMYHARKNHKQKEWRDFCAYIAENCPYSELITMSDKKEEQVW